MTRNDYELLARALLKVRNSYGKNWDPNLFRACDDHAHEIARMAFEQNSRFNPKRFLTAAGVPLDRQHV